MVTLSSLDLILAQSQGQLLLSLEESAKIAGISLQTLRNRLVDGCAPFPTLKQGRRRYVHARDLAAYIDSLQNAHFPTLPVTPAPVRRKRGRPTKAEQRARQQGVDGRGKV